MTFLKLNETVIGRRIVIFKLVDATDGYTPETGLTVAASEIRVSKQGAAEANSTGSVVEVAGGIYAYTLSAAEVNTVGVISLRVVKAGVREAVFTAQVVGFDINTAVELSLFDSVDTIETGLTFRKAMRLISSVLGGKVSGAGTITEIFRNAVVDDTNRVISTVDASGNRSAITYNLV